MLDSCPEGNEMMNTTWKAICTAIRVSLFNTNAVFPDYIDWNDVLAEASKQAVLPLVWKGVKRHLPPEEMNKWRAASFPITVFAVQLLNGQQELAVLLDDNRIPYCILKGAAAALYYPEPLLRTMGDVDFIVPPNYFEKVKELLIQNGYLEGVGDERHIHYYKDNILFEPHHHFHSDESDKLIDEYIISSFDHLETKEIKDSMFRMLPEIENGLVLLHHMKMHLFSGLGLRQVLDWMMYCHVCLDSANWEKFRPHAQALGLEKLALITTRLCVKYLGLEVLWTNSEDDETVDQLLANIIQSGNFGKAQGVGSTVERLSMKIRKYGLLSYLQEAGEFNWKTTLDRHSWLRPYAWIYQIGRYIRQAIASGRTGDKLRSDIRRSNERYELLRKLELI